MASARGGMRPLTNLIDSATDEISNQSVCSLITFFTVHLLCEVTQSIRNLGQRKHDALAATTTVPNHAGNAVLRLILFIPSTLCIQNKAYNVFNIAWIRFYMVHEWYWRQHASRACHRYLVDCTSSPTITARHTPFPKLQRQTTSPEIRRD